MGVLSDNVDQKKKAGAMQKSKSSSSVVHQGTRLVAKKMWKSRSKSQTRATPTATSTWTPQGNCVWTNVTGRSITLEDTSLLQLTDIERRVLQKVALAKLQALNLGVAIRPPSETMSSSVQKPKRRAHLLKRKAITTGFFDTNRKEPDKDKGDGGGGGLVFGIPLSQCVENERAARLRAGSGEETSQLRRKSQYGSRTSFTSLIETPRSGEEKGSCESLISPTLSMPGLLDSLSCGSTQDLSAPEGGVPNIVMTCLRHLEMHGLHTLGIFRVSSSKKRVRQLREDFDCGKEASLDLELCPHDVATLLKEYFRDLPDSLLCKDLYPAFIQTQRIRNRRLQQEALQNLIFLLPVPNRDTLWALLNLLSLVAYNSTDQKDSSGQWTVGNKMDSNNLATLFAPNILHSCSNNKSLKDEMSAERSEERADAINVVRCLIDSFKELYQVSAELLDEVYIHMMDSHPELLDALLRRRDIQSEELGDEQESEDISDRIASHLAGDSDDHVSNEDVRITKERRVWSREAFTHETAGMGGPDVEVRPRHKERGRERIFKKRWREESSSRRRGDSDTGSNTPSRRASATGQGSEDNSTDQMNSSRGSLDSGAITAILKIPVPATTSLALNLDDSDIPFIEDNERQQISLSMVRTTSSSSQRTRSHSGSDSSQASTQIHQIQYQPQMSGPGYDSAVGSSAALSSPPRITTPSASSYSSGGVYSSPPSWASTPPTSPDGLVTSVNYIPEEPTTARISIPTKKSTDSRQVILQRVTVKSAGEVQHVKSSYIQPTVTPDSSRRRSKDSAYQRLLSTGSDSGKVSKSASSSSIITYPNERIIPIVKEGDRIQSADRKISTSISSIGGAVLRSKTADIERMIKVNTTTSKSQPLKKITATTSSTTLVEKEDDKKHTKRRYTDARHQTRHLVSDIPSETSTTEPTASSTQTSEPKRAVVWKRREIISSEPKERRSYV
ncbi:rho GTPase activating protein at 102A isoform X2 [Lycorma delicatula]|uniref:rho GTPase activating protein at 102A isoform X2 n=1 Tax=Lycorma delicatula TaxID=130591 RepID=UPI003F50F4DE